MLVTWHTQFSFHRTMQDLTDEHLAADIEHGLQLMRVLQDGGRPKEPAFYMWHEHASAYLVRAMIACQELTNARGYASTEFWKFSKVAIDMQDAGTFSYWPPPWFRDADLCRSHRSTLLRASPAAYEGLWPGTPENMPLLWPVVKVEGSGAVAELRVAKADLPRLKTGELTLSKEIRKRVVNL